MYANLSVLGLKPLVRKIVETARSDIEMAAGLTFGSHTFLCGPFLSAFRKTSVYPSEDKDMASMLYEIAKPRAELFYAPYWLADVYENLGATFPANMDTDEIKAVRKNSDDFVSAIKRLDEEIDKAVRENFKGGEIDSGQRDAIVAKREEFRKRWFEDVVPAFEEISRRQWLWSMAMTGSIVAPVVALPHFSGILSIPAAITALAASRKIKELVDPAAEFLTTFFECNPIHLGFYKVDRELRKIKQRNDVQKNRS